MEISALRVAMIGAGAIGSHLAEALVRGGLRQIVVLDGESFEIGNVTRHTLGIDSVGLNKAQALARRLQTLSPDVAVEAIPENFVPNGKRQQAVMTCQLVIDCTGRREVLQGLAATNWQEDTWFASLAVGYGPKRTYLYTARARSFPVDELVEQLQPWMEFERAHLPEDPMYPAVGCYHPAFPASELDIQLASSVMGKQLLFVIEHVDGKPRLWARRIEQAEDGAISITDSQLAAST